MLVTVMVQPTLKDVTKIEILQHSNCHQINVASIKMCKEKFDVDVHLKFAKSVSKVLIRSIPKGDTTLKTDFLRNMEFHRPL